MGQGGSKGSRFTGSGEEYVGVDLFTASDGHTDYKRNTVSRQIYHGALVSE
jgi:hypothetical protein